MKIILICLLSLLASRLAFPMGHIASTQYRITIFPTDLKKTVRENTSWRMCGNYFADVGTRGRQIIMFGIGKAYPGKPLAATRYAFALAESIPSPSIDNNASFPVVVVTGTEQHVRFRFKMNLKDYLAALPCLAAEGTKL